MHKLSPVTHAYLPLNNNTENGAQKKKKIHTQTTMIFSRTLITSRTSESFSFQLFCFVGLVIVHHSDAAILLRKLAIFMNDMLGKSAHNKLSARSLIN